MTSSADESCSTGRRKESRCGVSGEERKGRRSNGKQMILESVEEFVRRKTLASALKLLMMAWHEARSRKSLEMEIH
jgi:hypothetical protein